jgi:YD repeat-containing protein
MTSDAPRGARTIAVPLPEARRIRRAIDSLNLPVPRRQPGAPEHPMGERGEAAQLAGALRAYAQQIEQGLIGGPLQEDTQKGWFTAYDYDRSALLAAEGDRLRGLSAFAQQGIVQLPKASQQMSVAAVALLVAHHAFGAAAEIAVGLESEDFDEAEAVKQSEAMYEAFDMLAGYVAEKRAQWAAEDEEAGD